MSDHVAVEATYALPSHRRYVEDYLRAVDPALRFRRSATKQGFYVLERRCRRSKPAHTSARTMTDAQIQARDGYVHVATVHPWFLDRPQRIIDKLHEDGADMHKVSAKSLQQELIDDEQDAKNARRRKRLDDFRSRSAATFDVLDRLGNKQGFERTRMNNVGLPAPTSAGESPAEESSDVHTLGTPGRREDGGVHHSSVPG
jgi:hypothetical protein